MLFQHETVVQQNLFETLNRNRNPLKYHYYYCCYSYYYYYYYSNEIGSYFQACLFINKQK